MIRKIHSNKKLVSIEHSRHRSIFNFLINLMAGSTAYTYLPQKPSLDIYPKDLPALRPTIFEFRRTHVNLL